MKRVDMECPSCAAVMRDRYVENGVPYPNCETCGTPMEWLPSLGSMTVIPDDIPGGILIEHGLCHADGSPRRFYSRSELKLAAAVKGIIPYHDVYAEGGNQRLADARHRDEWLKSGEAQRAKRDRDEQRHEKRRSAGR